MSTRLTTRLSAPIMAVSCLPLFVGVYGAWKLHTAQRRTTEELAINVRSVRAAEEIAIGIRDVRAHLDRFLLTGDPSALGEVPRLHRDTDRWLNEARRTALTPREHEAIARLTRAYDWLFAELERVDHRTLEARREAVRAVTARLGEILQPAQQYLDYNEQEIQRVAGENKTVADRMALGLLLLGVCGPAAGLLAGYGIARAVNRSLVRLSVPIRDAAGKLNEVVGPITVSAGLSLEEFEAVLRRVADQTASVVERLQQSQREALRAEQLAAVGQMAAGLAHELRNPLMSMKILVQSAAASTITRQAGGPGHDEDRTGLAGRDLTVLEEEITRLEHLTSTLLDFARPPQPAKRAFVVQTLIEDTTDLMANRVLQRDIRLDYGLPKEPFWLEADVGQIRQVLLNLLINALDAVPDGGSVRLELEGDCSPPRWMTLRVCDDGAGLPEGLGTDIFAPFVSTKPTGIGLGLSISRRIIESHGGVLSAANRPEGGAVFSVRLPCRAPGDCPVLSPERSAPRGKRKARRGNA